MVEFQGKYNQQKRQSIENDLGNKHDTDGDTSHKIELKVLMPPVSPNPKEARKYGINPVEERHTLDLHRPSGEEIIEGNGVTVRIRRGGIGMLERNDLHRNRRG